MIEALLPRSLTSSEKVRDIGYVITRKDRPLINWLNAKSSPDCIKLDGRVTVELIENLVRNLSEGRVVYLESGSRSRFARCGNGAVGNLVAKVFTKLNRIIRFFGIEVRLSLNESQDWIFILLHELKPLISDYYWEYEKGCYFYPHRLEQA